MRIANYYSGKPITFNKIRSGDVFIDERDPSVYLLKTNCPTDWPTIDLESGVLLPADKYDDNVARYHILDAELLVHR